jgi:phage terminase small subunit
MSGRKKTDRSQPTARERDFCLHYVRTLSAHQAAKLAGYSERSAQKNSYLLLRKPAVIAEIQRIRDRTNIAATRSSTEVVDEISRLAFSDALNYIKPDPDMPGQWINKSPDELTEAERAAVSKIRIYNHKVGKDENGEAIMQQRYSYELHDKLTSLIQMGRHFGIFDDKLRLVRGGTNRFSNLSPEQLAALRKKITSFMSQSMEPTAIEGSVVDNQDS